MGHGPRLLAWHWLALGLLLIVGGSLRAQVAADPFVEHRSSDEYDYERIALGLYESGTYGRGSTIHRAPGAPVLFAVANALRPTSSRSDTEPTRMDIPAAYWAQAAVGTLLIAVVWLLGLALGGVSAAALAAAVVAIYPPFVRGAGELLSEPLGTLLLTTALLLVVVATRRPHAGLWALAGAVLGLANLTRPDFLFLAPVLALVVLAYRDRGIPLRALVGFVAAGALVIAPWSTYVSLRAGHPVAVTTGDGAALYIGTSPEGRGSASGLRRAYREQVRRRFHRRVVRLQDVFRIVAPAPSVQEQDALLRRKALANLWYDLSHPKRFAAMTADKQRRVWWNSSNPGQSPLAGWMVPFHRAVLMLGLAGAAAGLRKLAGRRRLALLVAVVPVAYVAALHVVMPAEPRFNVPVMPALIAAGAAGALSYRRASA